MVDRGEEPRLALEPGRARGVSRERLGEDLDRDVPSEPLSWAR